MKEFSFIFQSPAVDIERSKDFYLKAGFHLVEQDDRLYAVDQSVAFFLNPLRSARPAVLYYAGVDEVRPDIFKKVNEQWVGAGPSNVPFVFEHRSPLRLDTSAESIFGNYAGLTLETLYLDKSIRFYRPMGFEPVGTDFSQGYLALTHPSGFSITLLRFGMCPHSFCNPSISYFNGKEGNPGVLQAVRANGLPVFEEVTFFNPNGEVDNIILRDPGGIGFFLFND